MKHPEHTYGGFVPSISKWGITILLIARIVFLPVFYSIFCEADRFLFGSSPVADSPSRLLLVKIATLVVNFSAAELTVATARICFSCIDLCSCPCGDFTRHLLIVLSRGQNQSDFLVPVAALLWFLGFGSYYYIDFFSKTRSCV
jgi:hypothetical protein